MLPPVILIQLHLYIFLATASTIKQKFSAHELATKAADVIEETIDGPDRRGRALELGGAALSRDDKMDDLFYSHESNALGNQKEGREEAGEEGEGNEEKLGRRPGRHRGATVQLNQLPLGDLTKMVDFDQLAENTVDEPEMVVNNHQVTANTNAPMASNSRHYATSNYHPSAVFAGGHKTQHHYGKYSPNMFANNYNLNYIHSLLTSKPALPSAASLSLQTMQNLLNSNPHGLTLASSSSSYGGNAAAASSPPVSPDNAVIHVSASSSLSAAAAAAYQPSGIRGHQVSHYTPSDNHVNLASATTSPVADYSNPAHCGRQQVAAASRQSRIVGGNSTYEGEFPWAVSIQRHGNHHCGGVIVGHRWILTAAHCVRSQLASNLAVRTGGHTLSRSVNSISGHLERDFPVDQIIMHDDFSRYENLSSSQMKSSASTNNADIALLKLKQEIHWNEHAWPVCFPSREAGNFSGHDATVIGWGKLNEKSEEFSNELQKVKLTIIDNKVCQNWFRQAGREMPIDERIICAGFKNGGKDACHGDSGGPLLSRQNGQYVVVGVVSTGIGCARPLLPGLYSRVSSYINWIERYITN